MYMLKKEKEKEKKIQIDETGYNSQNMTDGQLNNNNNNIAPLLMTDSQPVRNAESFKFFLELLKKE